MVRKIDISHKTVFFIAAFLALIWALFLIRDVIILLFVAIIIVSGLAPIVEWVEKKTRAPRALAIALVYIVIVAVFATIVSLVAFPLIEQTTNLWINLPTTVGKILPPDFIDKSVIQEQVANFTRNALPYTLEVFNIFVAVISIAVLAFYMLLERSHLDRLITQFFIGNEERVMRITSKIEDKLGAWLRGQVLLSLIIGSLSYVILLLLNVPYALPLAILAGILEVVPVIGPLLSAIPAVLIAYTVSPLLALLVAGAFFIVQQLENHLIVPQVMKKAVGLNPLVVIITVSIGGKLLGIPGALLAVPITVVLQIITEDILRDEKSKDDLLKS